MNIKKLHKQIVHDLKKEGERSNYDSDASEKDPKYKSYGVRAPEKKKVIQKYKERFKELSVEEKLKLIDLLIESEYGEQQEVAFYIISTMLDYYEDNLDLLKKYIEHLHGWSKIDGFCQKIIIPLFINNPENISFILREWNKSTNYWKRRASVVSLTGKVGSSGDYANLALELCENLIWDKEDMVQKGVGWCLKDNMKGSKEKIIEYVKELRKRGVSSTITLYAIRDLEGKERKNVLAVRKV